MVRVVTVADVHRVAVHQVITAQAVHPPAHPIARQVAIVADDLLQVVIVAAVLPALIAVVAVHQEEEVAEVVADADKKNKKLF